MSLPGHVPTIHAGGPPPGDPRLLQAVLQHDQYFFQSPGQTDIQPGPLGEGYGELSWRAHPDLCGKDLVATDYLEKVWERTGKRDRLTVAQWAFNLVNQRYIYQALGTVGTDTVDIQELLFWEKQVHKWQERVYSGINKTNPNMLWRFLSWLMRLLP